MKNDLDERMEELGIVFLDDGSVKLHQGSLDGYELFVTLHPCHLDYIGKFTGYVSKADAQEAVHRASANLYERIHVLATLLHEYTKDDETMRAVVAALLPEQCKRNITAQDSHNSLSHADSQGPNSVSSGGHDGGQKQLDLVQ